MAGVGGDKGREGRRNMKQIARDESGRRETWGERREKTNLKVLTEGGDRGQEAGLTGGQRHTLPSSAATFWALSCWGTCGLTSCPLRPHLCPCCLLPANRCRMELKRVILVHSVCQPRKSPETALGYRAVIEQERGKLPTNFYDEAVWP